MKGRKAASFVLMAVCLGLALFPAASALLHHIRKSAPEEISLRPAPTLLFDALVSQRVLSEPRSPEAVNLNTAGMEELMALPGIGKHLAGLIIKQREECPFYFLEDLRSIPGIGDKRIAALREAAYVAFPQDVLTRKPLPSPTPEPAIQ